jgi:hypothetical protein
MQPAALSVEPLILISGLVFLFVILPLAGWIVGKTKPAWRVAAVVVGACGLVFISFNLGRMTGLSMAWHHWRREYQDPLAEWQFLTQAHLQRNNTNALVAMAQAFTNENVQAYGREKLFKEGEFSKFAHSLGGGSARK